MDSRKIAATSGRTYALGKDVDNSDLRKWIVAAVPGAAKQLKADASRFKGKTDKETAKKIFDYLLSLNYKADSEEQNIKYPSALTRSKTADCKSFALFTAGVLENLKIPYSFVWASYDPKTPIPGHVYVKTNDAIIDAVWGKFNSEKPAFYKYYTKMDGNYITGLGNDCPCQDVPVNGWLSDKLQQFGNWVGEKAADVKDAAQNVGEKISDKKQALLSKAKVIGLAPGRGLFRVMVETNLDGFATKLAAMDQNKLKFHWQKVGGNYGTLVSSINKGKARPVKTLGFLAKLKKAGAVNGLGATGGLEEAIVVAAPLVGAAVGSIVPGAGTAAGTTAGVSLGAVLLAILPIVQDLISKIPSGTQAPEGDAFFNPGTTNLNNFQPETSSGGDFWNQTSLFGLKNKYAIGLGVAILAGVYLYNNPEKLNLKS